MVLTSRDDGTRLVSVQAPASGNIADVKQPLCSRPHSGCSEVSSIVLVDRRATLFALCIRFHLYSQAFACDDTTLAWTPLIAGSVVTAVILSYRFALPHTQPQTPARAPSVYTTRRCECIRQPDNPHTPASEIGPRVKLSTLLLFPPKAADDISFVRALFREAGGCTLILGTIHSLFCPKIEGIQTLTSKPSSMRALDLVKPITNKSDKNIVYTHDTIYPFCNSFRSTSSGFVIKDFKRSQSASAS
jgi:hypothetical protein